jgi:calcium-translocating P-type ATPase
MTSQSVPERSNETAWHGVSTEEALTVLGVEQGGLSSVEAASRLDVHGPNEIADEAPDPAIVVLLRQFRSPLIFILMVAAVVTALLDEWIDTWVIAAVLLLNAGIGFVQEQRAESSVRALGSLVSNAARVLRDGHERQVPAREVVPGDVVLLESGVRVAADLRLLHVTELRIDESLLTGESVPVSKSTSPVADSTSLADRTSMAYAGSMVTSGRGRGLVVATGGDSTLGFIAELMRSEESPDSPLQRRMARFARVVGLVVASAAILSFGLGILAGFPASEMFRFSVALAVAAIPEGLPIVLTITLAVGVNRMSQRNALIRRLAAVETLGSTTVIGSDKTGTLTENRMTVETIWAAGVEWAISDAARSGSGMYSSRAVQETLIVGVLANEAHLYLEDGDVVTTGDPTEAALLMAAFRCGIDPGELRDRFVLHAGVPFESERRYSAVFGEVDGRRLVCVKGAPERIIELSDRMLDGDGTTVAFDRDLVADAAHRMASGGLRVLAMAMLEPVDSAAAKPVGGDPEQVIAAANLTFVGLQGMLDPPRVGVADAVEGCRRAGIRPVMITGDHAATALAIGIRLGIATEADRALTGAELDMMSDEELQRVVTDVPVFARVSPEHKLRIVLALRAVGNVVAVTGDGVNDAPALRAADIGVAMGKGGTDVAREASDMVLADDNFASIYAAVHEGRVAFDNVRKVTFFLISTGAASIVALSTGLVLGWPLIMLPTQLLWLNLVTNGVQDVAMAFEPAEPGIIERSPRPIEEGVISRMLWKRTLLVGLVMATGTLWIFHWEHQVTGSVDAARTAALTTMVLFQAIHLGNVRSERVSAFRVPITSNRFLLIAAVVALAIHAAALYLPFTQFVLSVEPIGIGAWVRSALVALSVLVVGELHKAWERRRP